MLRGQDAPTQRGGYSATVYEMASPQMRIELGDQLEPKDIFVSYSRALRSGSTPGAIDGAALWGAEIVKAITGAKVMLVACSPNAFESHNVTKEISLASEKRKAILPLFIEPTTVPANVEYQLAGIQRIEIYHGDSEKNIIAVLRALRRLGVDFRPPEQPAAPDFHGWITTGSGATGHENRRRQGHQDGGDRFRNRSLSSGAQRNTLNRRLGGS